MERKTLKKAREYEKEAGERIPAGERPVFHLTPYTGWTNDPNGFSFYGGRYHLFYQYNPYDTCWDSMHWGHAVSKDLVSWEYLPAALAPEDEFDDVGCFSGTAIELEDGRHYIIYTGVHKDAEGKDRQEQCAAFGDGLDYVKFNGNPVITSSDLPKGLSPYDFRDPKVFIDTDGMFRCVAVGMNAKGLGELLLFASADGLKWHFESILAENDGEFGTMWECPDFFMIGDASVILTSPIGMKEKELEYHSGNGTLCLTGSFDRNTKRFEKQGDQVIDHGADFYAPQTVEAPDGRRIMIGWMQNWGTCDAVRQADRQWFGQMTVPRELSLKDGLLLQMPVRELERYRKDRVEYREVSINGKRSLEGIEGRILDLTLRVRPEDGEKLFNRFTVFLAEDGAQRTVLDYYPGESVFETDRSFSGMKVTGFDRRRCGVRDLGGKIELRIIMDRFSVEVFINGGEQAMTTTIFTDPSADKISFESDGTALMDIIKYTIAPAGEIRDDILSQ